MSAWSGSTRRRRLPKDWPQRRARVLRRDGYRCQLRYVGCTVLADQVDHVIAGDDHRDANLQAACSPCHARKSGREGNAARTPRAPRRRPTEPHPGAKPSGGG